MAFSFRFVGSPAAAITAVAGIQAQPGNAAEATLVANSITGIQNEITNVNAAAQVHVVVQGGCTAHTHWAKFQIDVVTAPLTVPQIIQNVNDGGKN